MTDMIVNLHLREMPEGDFRATVAGRPDLEVRGVTAGDALEKAQARLAATGRNPSEGAPQEEGVTGTASVASISRPITPHSGKEDLLRQVMILDHVENEDNLSQRRLAKLLDLNLSTVNQILKRLVRKGFVKTRRLNGRSVAYYLTPQGFSEKLRLVLTYTHCTIAFFSSVRDLVNAELERLQKEHAARTVAIFGSGELAEAAYLSAREQGMKVLSVHDRRRAGDVWLGYSLEDADALHRSDADVIIWADIWLEGGSLPQGDGHAAPHCLDLPNLLSSQLGRFARRMDSETEA